MKEGTKNFWRKTGTVCLSTLLPVFLSGIIRALGIYVFVTPNEFAPGGTNGLAVILEYVTGWSSGWFLIMLTVPLFFVAFFLLGKREAILSTASMLLSSLLLIAFRYIPNFQTYEGADIGHRLFAAVASGLTGGAALAIMLKSCGTSGGTAVLASLVNKKYKNISVSALTSTFDACVVFVSIFVYNKGDGFTAVLDPVLLALVALYVTSKVSDLILQGFKVAYKFEIITNSPEEIAKEIMEKTHHGVTKVAATGMYSHKEHSLLICIIRKRHIAELQRIIKQYPDTFATFSVTTEVFGKFLK